MKLLRYSFLILVTLLMAVTVFINIKYPRYFYTSYGILGFSVQWYGFEKVGNYLNNKAFEKLNNLNAVNYKMLHTASVPNTKNGNYDEAIQYLDKAVKLNPKEVSGYYGWVLLHYYRDYEKALPLLHNCNKFTPNFVDYVGDDNIFYAIGMCHKQLNNLDSAKLYFNKALENELSQHSESWVNHRIFFHKARVHHLRNELDSAIIYYNKTISVWDGASESYFYKGLLFNAINQLDSSCFYFNKAYEFVSKGSKTMDGYILEFDEIFEEQVLDTINFYCKKYAN